MTSLIKSSSGSPVIACFIGDLNLPKGNKYLPEIGVDKSTKRLHFTTYLHVH